MTIISVSLAFLVALFTLVSADFPVCSNTRYQWAYNSLDQSPCEVASYLGAVCSTTGANVDIPPLKTGWTYSAGIPEFAIACRCTTVVYSLLSVCALCQPGRTFDNWSTYSENCTKGTFLSSFPGDIPSGTRVPHWAYLDVVKLNTFSVSTAKQNLNASESTPIQQATSTSARAFTTSIPIPSHSAPTQDNGPKKPNAGAIAGGVIGGLAFLAIIGGSIFWLIRRHRKTPGKPTTTPALTSPPNSQHMGYNPVPLYSDLSPPLQKPYDPSDPSTFPTPSLVPYSSVTLPFQKGIPPSGNIATTSVVTAPAPVQMPMQGSTRYPTMGRGHGYSGAPEP